MKLKKKLLRRRVLRVAVPTVSLLLTLLVAELVYRHYLRDCLHFNGLPTIWVTSEPYAQFDLGQGFTHRPNVAAWESLIKDGALVHGQPLRTNEDGLLGRTTKAGFRHAKVKIAVFGDSFTAQPSGDNTWPDLLQARLTKQLDTQVAVLNFARSGYGILQMWDAMAMELPRHPPDHVVVAFIGDDLNRGRRWIQNRMENGWTRSILSSRSDDFVDPRWAPQTTV